MLKRLFKKLLGSNEPPVVLPTPAATAAAKAAAAAPSPVTAPPPPPEKPDIYTDVDGTLILTDWTKGTKTINIGLATALQEKHKAGHNVIMHTGGDPDTKKWDIEDIRDPAAASVRDFLLALPIQSKNASGKQVEITIDDEEADYLKHHYRITPKVFIDAKGGNPFARTDAEYFRDQLDSAIAKVRPGHAATPASTANRLA